MQKNNELIQAIKLAFLLVYVNCEQITLIVNNLFIFYMYIKSHKIHIITVYFTLFERHNCLPVFALCQPDFSLKKEGVYEIKEKI